MPEALDKKRSEAFALVFSEVNEGLTPEQRKDDSAVIDMLWARFGDDPETLNNLALEYLAQGTPLVYDAVADMAFKNPMDELKERIGIGRTKSFAALNVALGASETEVEQALDRIGKTASKPDNRPFVYLINQPDHRFIAVARKDWTHDRGLLREIVRTDDKALKIVRAGIDKKTLAERFFAWGKGIFVSEEGVPEMTEEGVNYTRLADKPDLIQKALAAKDWTNSPELAAELLGLNAFEARALVAAEIDDSPLKTTRLLWKTYHPQYKVWIPFATIGVFATLALAIFGQKAKRWTDMNA